VTPSTNKPPSAEWLHLENEIKRAAAIIREARSKLTNPAEIIQAERFAQTISNAISAAWSKANEPIGIL